MTVYADTSVLVAIVLEEASSSLARSWLLTVRSPVIVSDLAALEFAAVISRAVRIGRFDESAAAAALAGFDELRAETLRMSPGRREFKAAEAFVRAFSSKLSAPDALHLASARAAGASLATFDLRLADAAHAQGMHLAMG